MPYDNPSFLYDDPLSLYDSAGLPPRVFGSIHPELTIQPLSAGKVLWIRVRAVDTSNNLGPWSDVITFTPSGDPFAPGVPTDVTATAGYKLVSLTWPRVTEANLGHYQVRWTNDTAGAPDPLNWKVINTKSTAVVITGLDFNILYWFEVRAVTSSNLVQTSASIGTMVNADQNPEAGWSEAVFKRPSNVGSSDLAAYDIVSEFLETGELSADKITSGVLTVGEPGTGAVLEVRDTSGRLIGRWDHDGLLVLDPANSSRAAWMAAGELRVTDALSDEPDNTKRDPTDPFDPNHTTWTNSITAEGINASAITYGVSPGGHNNLPNSGFEVVSAFSQTTSHTWTAAADWAADVVASRVNLDVTTADLKLAVATY
jgi:hypothetical protein